MFDISVDANLFRIVATVCSKEESPFNLGGVFIEPRDGGGVFVVATDGHRILVAWDEAGKAKAAAIVKLDNEALAACKPPRDERRTLTIKADDAQVFARKIKGGVDLGKTRVVAGCLDVVLHADFPAWRKVIPTIKELTAPSFSSAYLSDMAAAGIEFRAAGVPLDSGPLPRFVAMRLSAGEKNTAALVRWFGVENAFGVLMPVFTTVSDGLPAFMALPKGAAA